MIIPWYDSDALCIIAMTLLIVVFLFGLTGIRVSNETPEFKNYAWTAIVLTALSGFTVLSLGIRLAARYFDRDNDID